MFDPTLKSPNYILDTLANMIHQESGIIFPSSHIKVLDQRIQTSLREKKITEEKLLTLLKTDTIEFHKFIGHITTNHTSFFRSIEQFHTLGSHILPDLIQRNKYSKRLLIWSAAASSGEEPYTLALYIQHYFNIHDIKDWSFMILATDIDSSSLNIGMKGIYPISSLKNIPTEYHYLIEISQRSTELNNNYIKIPQKIKNYIKFKEHNLLKSINSYQFDLIFCRNVLIYFDLDTQRQVVSNLCNHLKDKRYFFVSPSETLTHLQSNLTPIVLPKCIYYTNLEK